MATPTPSLRNAYLIAAATTATAWVEADEVEIHELEELADADQRVHVKIHVALGLSVAEALEVTRGLLRNLGLPERDLWVIADDEAAINPVLLPSEANRRAVGLIRPLDEVFTCGAATYDRAHFSDFCGRLYGFDPDEQPSVVFLSDRGLELAALATAAARLGTVAWTGTCEFTCTTAVGDFTIMQDDDLAFMACGPAEREQAEAAMPGARYHLLGCTATAAADLAIGMLPDGHAYRVHNACGRVMALAEIRERIARGEGWMELAEEE